MVVSLYLVRYSANETEVLIFPGVVDTYKFLMNTWNALPESYQQRVYKNTLASVKLRIQEAEFQTPREVISTEAAVVDNVMLLDFLQSEPALQQPEIGVAYPGIPIDNNESDDELLFRFQPEDEEESDDNDSEVTTYEGEYENDSFDEEL